MLKAKRSYATMMDTSPSCTPFSVSHNAISPPRKKMRTKSVFSPSRTTIPRSESKFANPPEFKGVLLRKYIEKTIQKNSTKKNKEFMFTLDELNEVITNAIQEREEELREEYDRALASRQQEQFQTFAKFNDDFITKKSEERYV